MSEVALEPVATSSLSPVARKTIWAAFIGFFVDMYDVYLPIVALPPAIEYFQPRNLPLPLVNTLLYVVLAVSLVGRPIGAIIFGHFGDKIGRRKTTVISLGGIAVATLLIALLPGYQAWGIWSIVALMVLRLVDGIFLGGEYTAANPLAMEYCPKEKRGIYGALINDGYSIGFIAISLATLAALHYFPAKGPASPYVAFGWRIPFLAGFVINAVFFVYFYLTVPESKLWQSAKKVASPLREVFSGPSLRALCQVFVLMNGVWLALYAGIGTLPGVLIKILHADSTTTTVGLTIVTVFVFFAFLAGGALGQRYGRRAVFAWSGVLSATVAPVVYYYMIARGAADLWSIVLWGTIIEVAIIGGQFGNTVAYINERFHTGVRASGYGIGYSLAIVLPSFYSFYMLGLQHWMPYKYTQLVLMVLGGLLIVVGALAGPETKDVDFHA